MKATQILQLNWKNDEDAMEGLRFPSLQMVIQNHVRSGEGMVTASMQIDALKKSRVCRSSVEVEIL